MEQRKITTPIDPNAVGPRPGSIYPERDALHGTHWSPDELAQRRARRVAIALALNAAGCWFWGYWLLAYGWLWIGVTLVVLGILLYAAGATLWFYGDFDDYDPEEYDMRPARKDRK